MEKELYPLVPYYTTRYRSIIANGGDISAAIADLKYFKDQLESHCRAGRISDLEMIDLKQYINLIIRHITDGNNTEKRMVDVMGGEVFETVTDKIRERDKIIAQDKKTIEELSGLLAGYMNTTPEAVIEMVTNGKETH